MSMLLETWYHALKTPHGIRIETPDRQFLINQLYQARQSAFDDELDQLAIVKDAKLDNVIWIVRKGDGYDQELSAERT